MLGFLSNFETSNFVVKRYKIFKQDIKIDFKIRLNGEMKGFDV